MKNKNIISIVLILACALGFVLYTIIDNASENISNTQTKTEVENNIKISGIVEEGSGLTIMLLQETSDQSLILGNSLIDETGYFELSTKINDLGIYYLFLAVDQNQLITSKVLPLTLVPGNNINIQTNYNVYETKPNIKGVDWADGMNQLLAIFSEENSDSLNEKNIKIENFAKNFILEDPDNPLNIYLYPALIPSVENLEILKTVAYAYETSFPKSVQSSMLRYNLYRMQPTFPLKTVNEEEFDISNLKGKVVLIDFWASWCGPCRRSNPDLVKLYNKFKDRNFEVLSVSLDTDKNQWMQAIKDDQLIWSNHISDLKGWESYVVSAFGINSIPYTMILDKNGILIGEGLHGSELEIFLNQALNDNE